MTSSDGASNVRGLKGRSVFDTSVKRRKYQRRRTQNKNRLGAPQVSGARPSEMSCELNPGGRRAAPQDPPSHRLGR